MGGAGLVLLGDLLTLDPQKRINAVDALNHEYFTMAPILAKPFEIPKFEESHELDRRKRHQRIPPPAPAGGVGIRAQNQDPPWDSRVDNRRVNGVWDNRQSRQYDPRGSSGPPPIGQPRIPPGAHLNPEHRPPWAAKNIELQSLPMGRIPPRDHGLPPRPPLPRDDRDRIDRSDGSMERSRLIRNGVKNVDTYIPSYGGPHRSDEVLLPILPHGRDDGRGRERDWDQDSHRDKERGRDRDWDWDRWERMQRDDRDYVRKRSRSPLHPLPDRDRDRDRDSRRAYGDRR